ncbi:hypothetical protein RHMOL_Rhmol07G0063400 [Rhododendron molle]|uniref:Uncharacterized protein n=1 Tax=Rhododendron molle TaxID=49168 RepID=A0ACC0MYD5_RHOML|nr:hypothetical protein RHMOL_Rhmol07G0063400 [Rhododendron molle]
MEHVVVGNSILIAIHLINEGALAEDSKILTAHMGSTLVHIYCEANQSADHLARLGDEQEEDLVKTSSHYVA